MQTRSFENCFKSMHCMNYFNSNRTSTSIKKTEVKMSVLSESLIPIYRLYDLFSITSRKSLNFEGQLEICHTYKYASIILG